MAGIPQRLGAAQSMKSLLGSGKRHLKDGDVLVLMKSLGKVRNGNIFNRTSVELRVMHLTCIDIGGTGGVC